MKRIFFLFAILIGTFVSLNAQGFAFGVRAIPTYNWTLSTDESPMYTYEIDQNPSFGIGPSLKYYISDHFNMDLGVIFRNQSFIINQTNEPAYISDSVDISENIKLKYVQLPINFNGQFDIVNNLQGIVNFGTNFSIVTNATRLIIDNNATTNSSDYIKFSNASLLDIYLTGGAGVDYSVTNNLHLTFMAQYNNGIIDAWTDKGGATPPSLIDNLALKNRNIALNFGLYIDF